MNAHASVVETRWGSAIMSSFHAAWSAGGLIGSAFGGLLIARGAGPGLQLGIEAGIAFAIAVAAVLRSASATPARRRASSLCRSASCWR